MPNLRIGGLRLNATVHLPRRAAPPPELDTLVAGPGAGIAGAGEVVTIVAGDGMGVTGETFPPVLAGDGIQVTFT